jgi:hypothetical protein
MSLIVRVRSYLVRVTVSRNYASNLVKELDFWVHNLQPHPEARCVAMRYGALTRRCR